VALGGRAAGGSIEASERGQRQGLEKEEAPRPVSPNWGAMSVGRLGANLARVSERRPPERGAIFALRSRGLGSPWASLAGPRWPASARLEQEGHSRAQRGHTRGRPSVWRPSWPAATG